MIRSGFKLLIIAHALSLFSLFANEINPLNGVMLQGFHWHSNGDGHHWDRLSEIADNDSCRDLLTAIWIPPPYKGSEGSKDVGYAPYDRYDLGEFYQRGSIRTKYGSFLSLKSALQKLKRAGFQVYADIVFNHMIGADRSERVRGIRVDPENRGREIGSVTDLDVWTHFQFLGRRGIYSPFHFRAEHFIGSDRAENLPVGFQNGIFKFIKNTNPADFNFEFAMGAKLDLNHPEVVNELTNWGKWLLEKTEIDGFRIDAARHIQNHFLRNWLREMRIFKSKDLFSVAEFFDGNVEHISDFLKRMEFKTSAFDMPLHYRFFDAAEGMGHYDMRQLFRETLVTRHPMHAVTFVDTHDTETGQPAASEIREWFKPFAYASILLRQDGYPCVFYPDYFGSGEIKFILNNLLRARRNHNFGKQNDYFDDKQTVGWTREGNTSHKPMAVVLNTSQTEKRLKKMYIGTASKRFIDITGNSKETVWIRDDGVGIFPAQPASIAVWIGQ